MKQRVTDLAAYLRGWKSYFGFCETPSVLKALDQWIRRRLRSVIWRQWRHSRVRFRHLREQGVGQGLTAQTVGSRHSCWRLALSPALQLALSPAYFDALGLPRLFHG